MDRTSSSTILPVAPKDLSGLLVVTVSHITSHDDVRVLHDPPRSPVMYRAHDPPSCPQPAVPDFTSTKEATYVNTVTVRTAVRTVAYSRLLYGNVTSV